MKTSVIIQRQHAVFGEPAKSISTVYRWIDCFNGITALEDDPHRGRPRKSANERNVIAVVDLLKEDRRMPIRQISVSRGIGTR